MTKRFTRQQLLLICHALGHLHDSHNNSLAEVANCVGKKGFSDDDANLVTNLFYELRDCLETIVMIGCLDSRSAEIKVLAEGAKERLARLKRPGETLDKIIVMSKLDERND